MSRQTSRRFPSRFEVQVQARATRSRPVPRSVGQREHHAAPRFLGGKILRFRGFVQAADPSPESTSQATLAAPINAPLVVSPRGPPCREIRSAVAVTARIVHGRKKLRMRHGLDLARLLHTRNRDSQIVIVLQRGCDQLLELFILEHFPPRQIGQRRLLRLPFCAAKVHRNVDRRALVVRADRAA